MKKLIAGFTAASTIIVLSTGCSPQTGPTTVDFLLSGTGTLTGTTTGSGSAFTGAVAFPIVGSAVLDLATGNLNYSFTGAEITIDPPFNWLSISGESGAISGNWQEPTLSATTGAGTMDSCEDISGGSNI